MTSDPLFQVLAFAVVATIMSVIGWIGAQLTRLVMEALDVTD